MTDLANGQARRNGASWHMPPTIARASASREKPQQPKAPIAPAPVEVVTLKSLPAGALYRIVTDLEGLREAFVDRIDDLDVPMTEIDFAGQLTRGNCQKILCNSEAKWSRSFGWKSLAKMLQGTGMVIALIVDDKQFEPIRRQMQQRRAKRA
jgi:hypothetical protein